MISKKGKKSGAGFTGGNNIGKSSLNRTGHILNRKLRKYMIPTTATALALLLDEFMDSIIVSNLLDLNAMTIISVASPIVIMIALIYMLFGIGGSTVYAFNIGSRNNKVASKAFSISMISGLIISLIVSILGIIFINPLCNFLCSDTSLSEGLYQYIRIVLFTVPLIVGIQIFSSFLPASGSPNISTLICIIANVTNMVLDIVYISVFDMGVVGAAYATLTGYVICLIFLVIMFLCKKIHIRSKIPLLKDFKLLKEIILQGGANAIGQLGYIIKFTFYNKFIFMLSGAVGLGTFAVAKQLFSIMGISLLGIADAVSPFLSVLKGQKDENGINYVLRSGIIYSTLITLVMMVIFECFPEILYWMFNVTDQAVIDMANVGIRIFLLLFLARGAYILFMYYARISGRKIYAMVISLLDGFVLLLPVALLASKLFDMNGIWLSFPITSFMIVIGMVIYNLILVSKSKGKLHGLFLLEHEEDVKVLDMTFGEDDASITGVSEKLTNFCFSNGVDKNIASRIGLIAEEMSIYTRRHNKKNVIIDIITRITDEDIVVDFRSEGTPFNPLAKSDEDDDANILLINNLPSNISYDYILGLNSTQFVIKKCL